ncbi:MAG: hypothetical protein AAF479_13815 [Pseudomonadota bacterium]
MASRSHKNRLCCTAQFVALIAFAGLSGCGTIGLFGAYDLPEDPAVADAPWPRLIDIPDAPAAGAYTRAAPDPRNGERTQADLAVAAVFAESRAEELAAPVISEEEKAALIEGYEINQEQRELEQKRAEAEAEAEAKKKAQ